MKHELKKSVYRVAVFNQIFSTKYYHVRKYDLNEKTGKYKYTNDIYGHRGPGGNLGMKYEDAVALAQKLNA